jgi:hypothetical protein
LCSSRFTPIIFLSLFHFFFFLPFFSRQPSLSGGWTPSIYWNAPNVTSFPVAPGSWISLSSITAFDVNFLTIAIGTSLCMLVVFSGAVAALGERAENFLMKFDIFVTEHPGDEGQARQCVVLRWSHDWPIEIIISRPQTKIAEYLRKIARVTPDRE